MLLLKWLISIWNESCHLLFTQLFKHPFFSLFPFWITEYDAKQTTTDPNNAEGKIVSLKKSNSVWECLSVTPQNEQLISLHMRYRGFKHWNVSWVTL